MITLRTTFQRSFVYHLTQERILVPLPGERDVAGLSQKSSRNEIRTCSLRRAPVARLITSSHSVAAFAFFRPFDRAEPATFRRSECAVKSALDRRNLGRNDATERHMAYARAAGWPGREERGPIGGERFGCGWHNGDDGNGDSRSGTAFAGTGSCWTGIYSHYILLVELLDITMPGEKSKVSDGGAFTSPKNTGSESEEHRRLPYPAPFQIWSARF